MDEPSNLPAISELPPLPEHQVEVWERLCTRMTDCRSRAGLYLMLTGYSYREAARATKLEHASLVDAARRYGLNAALHRTDRLVENHRALGIATTEEMLERARDGKLKDESLRDLAVTAGISWDKVRDWEKQQDQPQEAMSFLQQLASGLARNGMRLDLSLSPAGMDVQVVDAEIVPSSHTRAETPT